MNQRATEDKKRRSRLADQVETARVRLAAKAERARLAALHADAVERGNNAAAAVYAGTYDPFEEL